MATPFDFKQASLAIGDIFDTWYLIGIHYRNLSKIINLTDSLSEKSTKCIWYFNSRRYHLSGDRYESS